jgi:hypothetical protein
MKANRHSFGQIQESVDDLKIYGWGIYDIL